MSRRLYYVDWLRVLAVLLLFPFHTSRVFNFGEDFYIKGTHLSVALGYILGFISMWHMQLLFVLAGASAYFSLRRRTGTQFARERLLRLLVPLTFGIFVLIPPQTWVGAQFNSGYTRSFVEYITSGAFLQMNIQDGGDYYGGFGIGHLWFILFLFLISLIVLPLFLWGKGRGESAMQRIARALSRPAWWLLVAFVIVIAEGMPDIAGKNLIYYLVFFVLGYVVMSDESFMVSAEKHALWVLPIGLVLCGAWSSTGVFRDTLPDPSFQLAAVNLAGFLGTWMAVVGFLGVGKRVLDRPSPALSYLAESSYPVYILHQSVIVVAAFYLVQMRAALPVEWLAVFSVAVLGSFALYEVVRRVPALRFLFGMRPIPTAPAVAPEPAETT